MRISDWSSDGCSSDLLASRYDTSGPWMLKRKTAAGGAVLNLGIHFFDLFAVLMDGEAVSVASASMSNALAGHDIEDHGTITLRSGRSKCLIETGYVVPAPNGIFDMHFSIDRKSTRLNSSH